MGVELGLLDWVSVTSDDGGDEDKAACGVESRERLVGVGIHPKMPKFDAKGNPAAAAATAAAEYPAIEELVLLLGEDVTDVELVVIGNGPKGRRCEGGEIFSCKEEELFDP